MADTQRTIAQILALLADNSTGDITPQDIRDAFVTWRARHGQIYVAAADAGDITISDSTNFFEGATGPTWTLDSAVSEDFNVSAGAGRLTYVGTAPVMVHAACTVSFTAVSNNQLIRMRLGKSGSAAAASEVVSWCGTGSDMRSTALHLIAMLSNGEYLSLFAKNDTSSSNITISAANLQVVSMPM